MKFFTSKNLFVSVILFSFAEKIWIYDNDHKD